jgi:hypothetical protein
MANVISFHHTATFSWGVGGVYISYLQVFWEIFEYTPKVLYAKLAHITQNLNIFKHIPFALKERLELIVFSKVIYK